MGAELSVYIDKNYLRISVGKALYDVLINILKVQNIRTVYACITKGKIASEKFHTNLVFYQVADFSNAGYKNNTWYDVVWYEKKISNSLEERNKFISIKYLDKDLLNSILSS